MPQKPEAERRSTHTIGEVMTELRKRMGRENVRGSRIRELLDHFEDVRFRPIDQAGDVLLYSDETIDALEKEHDK